MNEQNVRKEAIKMTAAFIAKCIVKEAILIAIILLIDVKFLVIGMAIGNVLITFLVYSEFKKEVISSKEENQKKEEE